MESRGSATRTPASPHNDTSAPPGPSLHIKPPPLRTPSQTQKTSPLSARYQSAGNYNSEDEAFIEGPEEIKTWRSGEQFQHPLSQTDDDPWMTCNGIVGKFDKDMCDVWKDEIQNLLIFAGLFSAVVTAFTIESYQLLKGNSVTAHSERINILWFVSLSLSLATVSIGIVCMQWLREFQRDANLPPKDSVALRQMRYEGLLKWRVPGILSVLPLLLQGGLVLFLAGLLDLLWHLNHKVAIAVTTVVAGPMLFLAVTTVLPALQVIITQDRHLRIAQCPYKSPQSWAFYRVAIFSARFALYVDQYMRGQNQRIATKRGVLRCLSQVRNWLQYDIYWWQLREAFSVNAAGEPCLTTDSHDIIGGLVWIAEASLHSIPWLSAVQACFRDLDSLPAVKALRLLFRTKGDLSVPSELRVVRDPVIHQDIVAAHVLSYFREHNHQLHEFLLPHRTELYVRIRNSSVGSYNMKDGVTCPVSTFHDVKQLPKDIYIQFLYCFSSLLSKKDVKQEDMDAAWYIFVIILRDPQLPDLDSRRALERFLGSLERWVNETEGPARLRPVEGLVDHILAFHRSRAYALIRERVPECLPLFSSVLGSLDDAVVQYGFPESFSRMPDVDYWWGLAMEMRVDDTPVPGDTQ